MLWLNLEKFSKNSQEWLINPIKSLNVDQMEVDMKNYENIHTQLKMRVNNLSKDGKDKVLDLFVREVKMFGEYMPTIVNLGNKSLKTKHWKKIFEALNPNYQPSKLYFFL